MTVENEIFMCVNVAIKTLSWILLRIKAPLKYQFFINCKYLLKCTKLSWTSYNIIFSVSPMKKEVQKNNAYLLCYLGYVYLLQYRNLITKKNVL